MTRFSFSARSRSYGPAPVALALVLLSLTATAVADMDRARDHWDQGELREAGLLLKEHLTDQPDDVEARLLLAAVYLDLYRGDATESELRRARSAGASRSQVLPLLGRALLQQGRFQRLLDEVAVATVSDPTQQALLAALRGDAQRGLGNLQAAAAEYERALGIEPGQPDALMGQAQLALMDARVDAARQLLVTATERHPDVARVWELLAELDFARGDYAAAEQSLTKAVVVGRNKWMPRFKRALTRLELGKLDAAEDDIQAVTDELPKFPGLLFAHGALSLRRGDLEGGLSALDAYREYDPGNLRALYLSAVGEAKRGNHDLAVDLLRKHIERAPGSVPANRALAELLLGQRNPRAAEALLRKALVARPNRPELLLALSRALTEQGRLQEALEPVLRAVEMAPDVAAYRVAAAYVLHRLGEHDAAREQLDQALALDPLERTAPLMQVKILLEQQRSEQALELAQTLVTSRRGDPHALNALGLAQVAVGDEGKARITFEAALEADPRSPDAALSLAKLELRDGDTQGARELLEGVVAAVPGHVEAILALAELDALGADISGQQQRLREAVETFPDELRLRLALARSYLGNGAAEQAARLVQSAPQSMGQEPDLILVQAQAQMAVGDLAAALGTLQTLQLKAPYSATPHLLIAAVYAQQGNPSAMAESLVTGASMEPDSPLLGPVLTRALAQYESSAQQLDLLDRLLGATNAHPRLIAAKADLLVDLGEYRRAQRVMQKLYSRYPDDLGVMRRLVATQLAANARADAKEVLTDWIARNPEDAAASVLLTQVEAMLGETDAARRRLEELMASSSASQADPLILNNLAWLLRETDPERALGYAERALRADPSSAAVKDTLGILLVGAGDLDRALKLLEEAHIDEPTDPTIGYHYALALTKAHRGSEARVVLLSLQGMDFPERQAAQDLLAELAD